MKTKKNHNNIIFLVVVIAIVGIIGLATAFNLLYGENLMGFLKVNFSRHQAVSNISTLVCKDYDMGGIYYKQFCYPDDYDFAKEVIMHTPQGDVYKGYILIKNIGITGLIKTFVPENARYFVIDNYVTKTHISLYSTFHYKDGTSENKNITFINTPDSSQAKISLNGFTGLSVSSSVSPGTYYDPASGPVVAGGTGSDYADYGIQELGSGESQTYNGSDYYKTISYIEIPLKNNYVIKFNKFDGSPNNYITTAIQGTGTSN